ncbi:MAG: MarR family transcriptional regulator [Clostridia bacterium]|nr:MarR family transcriptional regulator [Clostridia bacterium]
MQKSKQIISNHKTDISFPLYVASLEILKKYRAYLNEFGLTYTQYIAMLVLRQEKAINVKALGKRLFLDSGTLTPMLKRLEAKQYIKRKHSKSDERVTLLQITKAGENLLEKTLEIPALVDKETNLSEQECIELSRLLYKLLDCSEAEAKWQ